MGIRLELGKHNDAAAETHYERALTYLEERFGAESRRVDEAREASAGKPEDAARVRALLTQS